jgi:hypothetical protein
MVESVPAMGEDGNASESRRRDLLPVLGILVGFVVIGLVFSAVTAGTHPKRSARVPRTQPAGAPQGGADGFDRTGGTQGLGRAESGQSWRSVRGQWGAQFGVARVLEPAPSGPSLALLPVGTAVTTVEVRAAAIAPGLGLAFRCQGAANCWRVEAVPRFGTWNVVKVVRGIEKFVANLGTVPVESGTTIRVDLEGGRLRFSVNGRLARTVNDSTLLSAARAGMSIRTGSDVRQARWDDFRAAFRSPGATP